MNYANSYKIVEQFEDTIAQYTNAPHAIAVDNCTNAIFLCCKYLNVQEVTIPSKTYLSVPQAILHAGGRVVFKESANNWSGIYQLSPYPIYDSAKRLTKNMYMSNAFMCLSFHSKKHLKIGKGGMILTDNIDASSWFKRARYEGRSAMDYHNDDIAEIGWNMYMAPQLASIGLDLLEKLPVINEDLDEPGGYKELTEYTLFNKFPKIP